MSEKSDVVYIDVVTPMNMANIRMQTALQRMDFRAIYILGMVRALSMAMDPDPIEKNQFYRDQLERHPLPSDPNTPMDADEYCAWMTVLEQIMRDSGTIGRTKPKMSGPMAAFFKEGY